MNIFQTDYQKRTIELLKETFSFKKYKTMPPVLAVFVFIFMLPFFLTAMVMGISLIINTFFFKIMKMPIEFLHTMVHSEGQDVKHATQAIIYWISWPFIFLLYAFLSFSLIGIACTYTILSVSSYVWTLGAFKFHAFMPAGLPDYSIEVNGKFDTTLPIIFIAVCGVISVLQLVFVFIAFPVALVLGMIYNIFTILFSVLAFAKHPKQ